MAVKINFTAIYRERASERAKWHGPSAKSARINRKMCASATKSVSRSRRRRCRAYRAAVDNLSTVCANANARARGNEHTFCNTRVCGSQTTAAPQPLSECRRWCLCVCCAHTSSSRCANRGGGGDDDSSPSPPATHMRVLNGDSS